MFYSSFIVTQIAPTPTSSKTSTWKWRAFGFSWSSLRCRRIKCRIYHRCPVSSELRMREQFYHGIHQLNASAMKDSKMKILQHFCKLCMEYAMPPVWLAKFRTFPASYSADSILQNCWADERIAENVHSSIRKRIHDTQNPNWRNFIRLT